MTTLCFNPPLSVVVVAAGEVSLITVPVVVTVVKDGVVSVVAVPPALVKVALDVTIDKEIVAMGSLALSQSSSKPGHGIKDVSQERNDGCLQ